MDTIVLNKNINKYSKQYNSCHEDIIKKYGYVVPILISARNEESYIKNTLSHIINSIINYKNDLNLTAEEINEYVIFNKLDRLQFYIFICDNNSEDNTFNNINEFKIQNEKLLEEFHINIFTIHENLPGKMNALKSLLEYLDIIMSDNYDHIIFTDAEIEWEINVYSELIDFKIKNPSFKLIGTKFIPRNKKLGFWGKIEMLPYYGYGETSPNGQGLFMKFVSGMCYLADKSTLDLIKYEIPANIGNEDVAISAIMGKNKIHILNNTSVYYFVSENLKQFFYIRGRHIRELYKLERWFKQWYLDRINNKKSETSKYGRGFLNHIKNCIKNRFYDIAENRTLNYTLGFYKSTEKFKFSINGLINWFKNIYAIKMGVYFIFVFYPLSIFWYAILKTISYIHSFYMEKEGWQPLR